MPDIVQYGLLLLVAILAYISLVKFLNMDLSRRKRRRLSSLLGNVDKSEEDHSFVNWLKDKGLLDYINPQYTIEEAARHGVVVTKMSYIMTFVSGTVLGVICFIVYFQPFMYLVPLALIGGIITTSLRLQKIRKEFTSELDSKLSIYMSSFSTAYSTFQNPSESLKSIIPNLESPVKEDVEKAYLLMADGKDVKTSFRHMNEKYPQKAVRLFHSQLDVLVKTGTSEVTNIRTVAKKMKRKEVFKRKLQTVHHAHFKIWRGFCLLTLSAPFLFLISSVDTFLLVMTKAVTSIVFALVFLMIFVVYKKLHQLEVFDPTE